MGRSGFFHIAGDARHREGGFTLIELMITVVVVSILAAIAFPSYAMFMKKSRRGDTEATLMDIAQREQQYLLDTRTYADLATLNPSIPADVSAYYTIQICQTSATCPTPPGGAPPTFAIVATPKAGSAQAGDSTLTLDHTGVKSPASVW